MTVDDGTRLRLFHEKKRKIPIKYVSTSTVDPKSILFLIFIFYIWFLELLKL